MLMRRLCMNSTWAPSALFLPAISSLFTSLSPSLLLLPSLSCSPFPPSLLLFLHRLPAPLSLAQCPVVIWEVSLLQQLRHTSNAQEITKVSPSPCLSSPHLHGVPGSHSNPTACAPKEIFPGSNPTAWAPKEIFPGFGSVMDEAWPGD